MSRERITRHDVKARIEEFNDLAGHQQIHKGMTSRDLTENVEQLQVYRSLLIIRTRAIAALANLSRLAQQWQDLFITARTHNVAAQPTTLGKRMAMFGEELLIGLDRAGVADRQLPGARAERSRRHPNGPAFSVRRRCRKSRRAGEARRHPPRHARRLDNVGQVYPRSLDLRIVAC